MKIEQFVKEPSGLKNGKYRTLNIDEDLHLFFKQAASHYNVTLSSLIFKILSQWRDEYQEEIKNDVLKKLGSS